MDQMETPQSVPVVTKVKSEPGFSFKGLVRVFSSPTEFFTKLKDDPKVLVPLLTILVLTLVTVFFLLDQMALLQAEIQSESLRDRGMSEAQIQQILESPMMKVAPLIGSVFVMATPFLTAGLAMMIGGFIMGGKSRYWKVVSVMAYCEVIYFAGGLVNLPFQIMKETMTPAFSLAVLAPNLTFTDPLFILLAKIGPFYIWHIIAAGIGLSILFEFSRNKGYLLAVLSIGLLSALHIGTAALGQMFN